MVTEYTIWVFAGNPLMKEFESPSFKEQSGLIARTLSEAAKDGWRVVAQSVLPEVVNGFGLSRAEQQEIGTKLRLVYTLARER